MTTTAATTKTLAERALRMARGKATTRRPEGGEVTKLATNTKTRVATSVRTGYNTACWTFTGKGRKAEHQVALGDLFHTTIDRYPRSVRSVSGKERHALRYAEALLRHERWHGQMTTRDIPKLAEACHARRLPFAVVNLFEDARIEAAARTTEGKAFDWWKFNVYRKATTSPTTAFWQCITSEAGSHYLTTSKAEHKAAVTEFWNRACKAVDTWAVLDLVEEWLKYWAGTEHETASRRGEPGKRGVDGTMGGESDGSADAKSGTVEAPSKGELGGGTPDVSTEHTSIVDWTYYARATEYGYTTTPIVASEVERLAAKLAEVIVASRSPRTVRIASSGSRIYAPGVAVGADGAFRSPGKRGGVPHLVVIMDMSGSMFSNYEAHGRLFLAACLRLIRRGVITGSLWFSGDKRYARIPNNLTDAQLATTIPCWNYESIKTTLDAIRPHVEAAHATVIYTDAAITDGDVDAGKWRARGAELIGACTNPAARPAIVEDMKRHFGRAITGRTGYELATKLVQYLGNRA